MMNSSVIADSAVTRTVIFKARVCFNELGVSGFAEWPDGCLVNSLAFFFLCKPYTVAKFLFLFRFLR